MSQTLYAHETPAAQYDPSTAARWQATQVSTISVTNFLGRIFIGLVSDFSKHTYSLPRSYCLTLVSVMFLLSQLVTIGVTSISTLWIASLLLGLAYGSVFSLFPTVCLEWFGMRKHIHKMKAIQTSINQSPSSLLRKLGIPVHVPHSRSQSLLCHIWNQPR